MRILIHTPERHVHLILPSALVLNRTTAALIARSLRKEADLPVTAEQISPLFSIIHAEKKRHPDWVMVDVRTENARIMIKP